MKLIKFIGNIFYTGILLLLSVFIITSCSALVKGEQPTFFNRKFYVVITGSMAPTIEVNDLIIVEPKEASQIEVGDVITFRTMTGAIVTHRVVQTDADENGGFKTKGDGNESDDISIVSASMVEGEVVAVIPRVGLFIRWFQNNVLVVIGSIVAIYFGISAMRKALKESKI